MVIYLGLIEKNFVEGIKNLEESSFKGTKELLNNLNMNIVGLNYIDDEYEMILNRGVIDRLMPKWLDSKVTDYNFRICESGVIQKLASAYMEKDTNLNYNMLKIIDKILKGDEINQDDKVAVRHYRKQVLAKAEFSNQTVYNKEIGQVYPYGYLTSEGETKLVTSETKAQELLRVKNTYDFNNYSIVIYK